MTKGNPKTLSKGLHFLFLYKIWFLKKVSDEPVRCILAKKNTSLEYKKLIHSMLQRHCDVPCTSAIPSPNAIALHPEAHCIASIAHRRLGGTESIILSASSTKSMMLSACAESIILSAPPTESMMLSG